MGTSINSEEVKRAIVTGAAGFIGSHLVDRLIAEGWAVDGVDNFATGMREFLSGALTSNNFHLHERDLKDPLALRGIVSAETDCVFHLAANADIKEGLAHPRRDLEENTLVTSHVLEAMRQAGASRIIFSSTGSVYGDCRVQPTPEDAPFPVQNSLYAASKLAGEGLISAYCAGYGFRGTVFRFVSIMGERYTHGHVFDFLKQLRLDPTSLRVLGDGQQRKSYLYVGDCVEALYRAATTTSGRGEFNIFNLGTDEYIAVDASIGEICATLGITPKLQHTGGERGWVGDVPFIWLDTRKIRQTGWKPKLSIRECVVSTTKYLSENGWLFDRRS
jgi:UDP-glucose 4-epimerase